MKKFILYVGIVLTSLSFLPQSDLKAQTNNPWDGPRWSSVKVTQTVSQWISNNGHMPDEEGEWVHQDWSYEGQSIWKIVITWGDQSGLLGTHTLYVKNNGNIIKEE